MREHCSPRHVPDRIVQIDEVPRTLSNKKLEVPVKKILLGAAPESAASRDSLANPEALDFFSDFSVSGGLSSSSSRSANSTQNSSTSASVVLLEAGCRRSVIVTAGSCADGRRIAVARLAVDERLRVHQRHQLRVRAHREQGPLLLR